MQFDGGLSCEVRKYFDFYEEHILPVIKSNNKVTQTDY
jgi:hypothetical protein